MAVRNYLKANIQTKDSISLNFPCRDPRYPPPALPEHNPEPTTARGWRRRNGK